MDLTTKQRQYLKGIAHHLKPCVQIGGNGLTSALADKTREELENHELIKVKIGDGPMGAKDAGPMLAEQVEAQLVQVIGKTIVLYKRRRKDPEIKLP